MNKKKKVGVVVGSILGSLGTISAVVAPALYFSIKNNDQNNNNNIENKPITPSSSEIYNNIKNILVDIAHNSQNTEINVIQNDILNDVKNKYPTEFQNLSNVVVETNNNLPNNTQTITKLIFNFSQLPSQEIITQLTDGNNLFWNNNELIFNLIQPIPSSIPSVVNINQQVADNLFTSLVDAINYGDNVVLNDFNNNQTLINDLKTKIVDQLNINVNEISNIQYINNATKATNDVVHHTSLANVQIEFDTKKDIQMINNNNFSYADNILTTTTPIMYDGNLNISSSLETKINTAIHNYSQGKYDISEFVNNEAALKNELNTIINSFDSNSKVVDINFVQDTSNPINANISIEFNGKVTFEASTTQFQLSNSANNTIVNTSTNTNLQKILWIDKSTSLNIDRPKLQNQLYPLGTTVQQIITVADQNNGQKLEGFLNSSITNLNDLNLTIVDCSIQAKQNNRNKRSFNSQTADSLIKIQFNDNQYGYFDFNITTVNDYVNIDQDGNVTGLTELGKQQKNLNLNFDTIKGINNDAFKNEVNLETITLPSSISTIGENAFNGCSKLTTITGLQNLNQLTTIGTNAFSNCISLINITLPDSLTTIPSGLFVGCASLTTINIPSKITSIGDSAFSGCSKLTTINGLENASQLTTINNGAFQNSGISSITLPSSITSIGTNAFNGCSKLTTINGLNSLNQLTTINDGTFQNSGISSITLPSSISSIGTNAFNGCSKLTTINGFQNLNKLTTINDGIFQNSGINSITLPSSITSIGANAFNGCSKLTSINLSNNTINSIGDYAFANSGLVDFVCNIAVTPDTQMGTHVFANCSELKNVTDFQFFLIPDYTFYNCTSLSNINTIINESTESIGHYAFANTGIVNLNNITSYQIGFGNYAFSNCTKLATVDLSKINASCSTSISDYMFYNCTSLTSIQLPNTLSSIGISAFENTNINNDLTLTFGDDSATINNRAFYNCKQLKSININKSTNASYFTIENIGVSAFENCTSLTSILSDVTDYNKGMINTVNNRAFYNCTQLVTFNIDVLIGELGNETLYGTKITNFTASYNFHWDTTSLVFSGCNDLKNVNMSKCTQLYKIEFDWLKEQYETIKFVPPKSFQELIPFKLNK